jgi:acetyl esterase/lipase
MSQDPIAVLDPELREPIREAISEPVVLDDIPAARLAVKDLMAAKMQVPSVLDRVEVEERVVSGPEGAPDLTLRIIRPKGRQGLLPALLWMHGGGYVMGCAADDEAACAKMAMEADCVAVAVEYRLAPEDPFPAALEDCYAALLWMAANADELGIHRSCVAIGGASAGGGLAAGLALLARDRGEIDVVFQLLVYPMLDDSNVGPVADGLPDALFWTRANNLVGWRSYLGCEPGGESVSCYASAPRAGELEGLPPACISVGALDLFVQEDIAYAGRLIQAGVPTELHVYPGGCHGFDMLVPEADVSRRFTADLVGALRRGLHANG